MKSRTTLIAFTLTFTGVSIILAQPRGRGGDPPPMRRNHTANTAKTVTYLTAKYDAPAESKVTIELTEYKRIIESNVMPDHKIGRFPNSGNPNSPSEQKFKVSLPLSPQTNEVATKAGGAVGILVNGVLIEAGTGEFFFPEDNSAPWNYNALGGAVKLGIDENHAHVQPTGKYHYHGIPTALFKELNVSSTAHSPIIGWSFDGFPIYGVYGYSDPTNPESKIVANTSSYQLKEGARPVAPEGPGGTYDGAFNDDFKYIEGLGTLDECNGRFTITPEFPEGTYAYFMTTEWPVIPNHYRGTPVRRQGARFRQIQEEQNN